MPNEGHGMARAAHQLGVAGYWNLSKLYTNASRLLTIEDSNLGILDKTNSVNKAG